MQKIALITGANCGLGLETARQLAPQNFTVNLGARDAVKGEAAAQGLRDSAGNLGHLASNVLKVNMSKENESFIEPLLDGRDNVPKPDAERPSAVIDTLAEDIAKAKELNPKGEAMPTNTMKVIRLHEFGGPKVLRYEDVPIPDLKPGEVLVRVHAVGLNPPDWYLRDGYKALPAEMRPSVPLPVIPGSDVSGVVEAVAEDVQGFSVGDEVFGMIRFPSYGKSDAYAEYVAAPASDLALKPAGIDHVHAAAAAMSGLTAWQFLIEVGHNEPNPLQPERHRPVPLDGKTLLVNGAAGGVGHFAVQLAKWKGAHVIAVASGTNESFLRDLGADEFIDYTKNPAEDVAHDVDLVLDTLGGPKTARFLRTLKRGGALFPVFPGFSDAEEAEKLGVTVSMTQVRSNGPQLAELGRLLDAGTVRVAIDSTFPLADARKAHERAASRHIQGKIVLTVA